MLFKGRTLRSLDNKGRLMLTPHFKDVLTARCREGALVLTTYDDCIVGYPLPDWEELEEKFNNFKSASRRMRDFRRLVIGGAEEVKIDGNGRVQIPQAHREYAGLVKDLVLVGQGRTFEIWDQARFTERTSQSFDDVCEELAENGIDLLL